MSSSGHYIRNSSIIHKSSQTPGNQLRFSIQGQQPAVKLISSFQIEPTKGILPATICWNQNPIYSSGHYIQNSSIIQKLSQTRGNQLRFSIQDQQPTVKLI
jgi:hypothetical protein